VTALIAVVSADNLASGIASAAFIAYLSGLTNVSYSATQYALFSSMMLLLPKFIAGFSGDYVNAHGYAGLLHQHGAAGLAGARAGLAGLAGASGANKGVKTTQSRRQKVMGRSIY
jgi:hypothetical protein